MDKKLQEKVELSNDLVDFYIEGKIWDKVKKVWRDHKGKIITGVAAVGAAGAAYANRDKISSGIKKAKEKVATYQGNKKQEKYGNRYNKDQVSTAAKKTAQDKQEKYGNRYNKKQVAADIKKQRQKSNEKLEKMKFKKQPVNTTVAAVDHENKKIDQKHKDYNRSQTKEELAKTGITKLGGMIDKRKQPTKMDLKRQAAEKKKANLKRYQKKQAAISKIKDFEKSQKEVRQQRKKEQGRLNKRKQAEARRKKQQAIKDKNKNK